MMLGIPIVPVRLLPGCDVRIQSKYFVVVENLYHHHLFLILAVFAFIQSNSFSKLCFIILRFILFKIYMYNVITKYIIFLNILNVMYCPN